MNWIWVFKENEVMFLLAVSMILAAILWFGARLCRLFLLMNRMTPRISDLSQPDSESSILLRRETIKEMVFLFSGKLKLARAWQALVIWALLMISLILALLALTKGYRLWLDRMCGSIRMLILLIYGTKLLSFKYSNLILSPYFSAYLLMSIASLTFFEIKLSRSPSCRSNSGNPFFLKIVILDRERAKRSRQQLSTLQFLQLRVMYLESS